MSSPRVLYSPRRNQDLTGQRSLKINILQAPSDTDGVLTFRSLGVDPELVVTLTNHKRFSALGWGLALIVALIGVAITGRPIRKKAAFILTVAALATIVPLVTGGAEVALLCNMMFYAACCLIPYYVLAGAARGLWTLCRRVCPYCAPKSAAMLLLAIAVVGADAIAKPQAAFAQGPESSKAPYVIQVTEPAGPVAVPEDALILPYDPDWRNGVKDADRVLVPYEKYVELWNRAHPDKKIETKAPPAPYALAGAAYKTLLEGDEYLLVTGELQIDVFSDAFVQIPLGLSGGVLAQAELDGKPARLSAAPNAPPQAASTVLYVSGKGRHKLDISVRLKLSRQGGWRVVQAVLPAAAASSLSIVVPKPQTELRLGEVLDRRKYDTEKPDETIRTALGPNGAVSILWRPVVAEGQIDRSLTAVSEAVFGAQEDGLRLTWQLGLEFRRGQREQFSVNLPAGYLLEKVEGNNVRGWEIRKTDRGQSVEIALLQPAKDYERFTLRLWRAGPVGQKNMTQFDVPQVTVSDAALHTGRLTIRRSPLLELRTLDRSGVTRTDLPAGVIGGEDSPLGIQMFEAYTFAAVPFTVRLSAAPVSARVSATVQTVLKLAEFERNIESNILLDVQGRRIYQVRMLLPDGLRLDRVLAPGAYQYAVTQQGKRSLLTIYLAEGQQGNVPVRIRGRLGRDAAMTDVPLPKLEVLDVERQQGDIAVQADPAFDVETLNLTNCEPVLLGELSPWLNPQQQSVTRLGLHYRQGDYSGTLRLRPRKPEVTCDTITNVRVTDRSLEETILLNFTIQRAGIRKLSFLLPATMADSRITVEKLRQKTVQPVSKETGAPVRVTIEFQDEEMGSLRVLVENDRLLKPRPHNVPIPTIETEPEKGDSPHLSERPGGGFAQMGTVPLFRFRHRYAVIQNAGPDEVVVDADKLRDMEPLGNRQKEWATLRAILGREMTMAYLVATDAREPRLVFRTESHDSVATVKARIGLAESTLMLDGNGAYRGQLILKMDNATEQFLEIRLPEGARLWTARVAGDAVKPTNVPGAASPLDVRIPIIKTARGDLSYEIVLKYGGKMPELATIGAVEFPLIHCNNITPELSSVWLYVPAGNQWFDFGGTMRRVGEDADLLANRVKFQTKDAERNIEALRQGDAWTKIRASTSLRAQKREMQQLRSSASSGKYNPYYQSELALNKNIDQQVDRELAKQVQSPAEGDAQDNRQRLNLMYQSQKTTRARNVVNDVGANWGDAVEQKPAANATRDVSGQWMMQNNFNLAVDKDNKAGGQKGDAFGVLTLPGGQGGGQRQSGELVNPNGGTDYGGAKGRHQPSAAQVLQVAPQQVAADDYGVNGQPQDRGYQSIGGLGNNVQADGKNDADARRRYEERRNQQMGLAGAYTRGMADVNYFGGGSRDGKGGTPLPPTAAPATPPTSEMGGAPGRSGKPAEAPAVAGTPALQGGEVDYTVVKPKWEQQAKAVQRADAGLASLDFELPAADPARWSLYRFSTPRGDEKITVRNISNDLVWRLVEIVAVVVALLFVWIVIVMIRHGLFRWMASPVVATLLICFGLLSLCGGLAPIVGIIAIVAGCGVFFQRWTSPKPLAA